LFIKHNDIIYLLLFLFSIQKIEVRKDEKKKVSNNDPHTEWQWSWGSRVSVFSYFPYVLFCLSLLYCSFSFFLFHFCVLTFLFFSFTHWIFGCQNSLFFRNIKADVSFCGRLVALTFFYWNKHRYWYFWINKTLEFRLRL
jgi:hypothetical protein